MPVFTSGKANAPAWCEMEDFELIEVGKGQTMTLERQARKEEFIVCHGFASITAGKIECTLPAQGKIDLNDASPRSVTIESPLVDSLLVRAMGRWKSITGSGHFDVWTTDPPTHDTPYDYVKTTRFDNHYHDLDEYWIFYEGECRVASEGKLYDVGPGDCVATGMGWHHDVVSVKGERVKAIYFEGSLEGRKRTGHLWEPTHGKAEPQMNRV